MQATVLALAFGSAAAFVAPQATKSALALSSTKDEMVALAEANPDLIGRTIGFW